MVTPSARRALMSAAVQIPPFIALNGANLSKSRAAFNRARSGGGRMVVAHWGDSTSHGYQNNGANGTRTSTAANSYPSQLAAMSQATLGISGIVNSLIGASDEAIGYMPTYEPRYAALGSSSLISTGQASTGIGGQPWTWAASGAGWQFTPTGFVDTVDVYYLTDVSASNGTANVTVNGTTVGSINCNQAQALRRARFSFTRTSSPTIQVVGTSTNNIYLQGADAFDSTARSISHLNLGWGGSTVGQNSSSAYGYSPLPGLKAVAPDLTIINLCINDWDAGTSVTAYQAGLSAMIQAARLSGDVALTTGFPSDFSNAPLTRQQQIMAAAISVATANNAPVIDLYSVFKSYMLAVANGYSNDYYKLHPNTTGYGLIASTVNGLLRTYLR